MKKYARKDNLTEFNSGNHPVIVRNTCLAGCYVQICFKAYLKNIIHSFLL